MRFKFLTPNEAKNATKGYVIYRSNYAVDNAISLEVVNLEEGPFCMLTENLSAYGITPGENEIIISHDMYHAFWNDFLAEFYEFLVDSNGHSEEVIFGPFNAKGLKVQLKSNWKDLALTYDGEEA